MSKEVDQLLKEYKELEQRSRKILVRIIKLCKTHKINVVIED